MPYSLKRSRLARRGLRLAVMLICTLGCASLSFSARRYRPAGSPAEEHGMEVQRPIRVTIGTGLQYR